VEASPGTKSPSLEAPLVFGSSSREARLDSIRGEAWLNGGNGEA
jgi:hypothetical protein